MSSTFVFPSRSLPRSNTAQAEYVRPHTIIRQQIKTRWRIGKPVLTHARMATHLYTLLMKGVLFSYSVSSTRIQSLFFNTHLSVSMLIFPSQVGIHPEKFIFNCKLRVRWETARQVFQRIGGWYLTVTCKKKKSGVLLRSFCFRMVTYTCVADKHT